MPKPKRWTSAGRVVGDAGAAEQLPLLPDPTQALTAAGWHLSFGGDDTGHIWGHAERGEDTITADDRSMAAVLERLWRAASAADA